MLRIFGSISHIFTYIRLFFSLLAGIIPLSLRNGGHLIPFSALVCKWGGGQLPPLPPGSAAYDHIFIIKSCKEYTTILRIRGYVYSAFV